MEKFQKSQEKDWKRPIISFIEEMCMIGTTLSRIYRYDQQLFISISVVEFGVRICAFYLASNAVRWRHGTWFGMVGCAKFPTATDGSTTDFTKLLVDRMNFLKSVTMLPRVSIPFIVALPHGGVGPYSQACKTKFKTDLVILSVWASGEDRILQAFWKSSATSAAT